MVNVSEEAKLYTSADRVWEVIGAFTAIDRWHPAVLGCTSEQEGTQSVRRLDVGGEAPVVERLESHDEEARSYSYSLLEGPLPVKDYTASLSVHADDPSSTTVRWTAEFEPDGVTREEAVEAVRMIFRQGLDHLRFILAG